MTSSSQHPVRRLSYCSVASGHDPARVPADLAGIILQARRGNSANGIGGKLQYRNGLYFQIIEGPPDAVGALFERIRKDPRHADVTLVVDQAAVRKPMFEEPGMMLAAGSGVDPTVAEYFERQNTAVRELDESLQRRLRVFHQPNGQSVAVARRTPAEPRNAVSVEARTDTPREFRLGSTPLHISQVDQLPLRMQVLSIVLRDWASEDHIREQTGLDPDFIRSTLEHRLISPFLHRRMPGDTPNRRAPQPTAAVRPEMTTRRRVQHFFQRFFQ